MKRVSLARCMLVGIAFVCGVYGAYGYGPGGGLRLALARIDDQGIVQIREITSSGPQETVVKIKREKDGKIWEEDVKFKQSMVNERITQIDGRALKVFDTDRKELNGAKLPELLEREVPVVLADNPELIDRRVLPVLKKGTLIITGVPFGYYHGGPPVTYPAPVPAPGVIVAPPAKKVAPAPPPKDDVEPVLPLPKTKEKAPRPG